MSNNIIQLPLPGFNQSHPDEWTTGDWETPAAIATKISNLIRDDEVDILEPAAGSGQIVKAISPNRRVTAIEIKSQRYQTGIYGCLWANWLNTDFFHYVVETEQKFDLIVTNPPFDRGLDFVWRSLSLLKPSGRLLFLMPLDFNCGVGAGNAWNNLNCHIHHVYRIQGRVAYLDKQGIPQSGRQIYDAVFDIRPGKDGAAVSFL